MDRLTTEVLNLPFSLAPRPRTGKAMRMRARFLIASSCNVGEGCNKPWSAQLFAVSLTLGYDGENFIESRA